MTSARHAQSRAAQTVTVRLVRVQETEILPNARHQLHVRAVRDTAADAKRCEDRGRVAGLDMLVAHHADARGTTSRIARLTCEKSSRRNKVRPATTNAFVLEKRSTPTLAGDNSDELEPTGLPIFIQPGQPSKQLEHRRLARRRSASNGAVAEASI